MFISHNSIWTTVFVCVKVRHVRPGTGHSQAHSCKNTSEEDSLHVV